MKQRYITRPSPGTRFHVFEPKTNRAMCGKAMMLFVDESQCEIVTGNEVYQQGQDCKECFRKAGLQLAQAKAVK